MTDPAEGGKTHEDVDQNGTSKLNDTSVDNGANNYDDHDESKVHLINANGGAGGRADPIEVKIVDGTASSSEAEVSFTGLGKDEVMKYAEEPFWKKLRLILFILFWVGWFAMLVTAIVIIVLAPRCPPRPDLKWYQTDTVYQVMPKSFKDSNGDGIGDFEGLKDKEEYIFDDLEAGAIWLSSMYKTDAPADDTNPDSYRSIMDHKAVADWFGATPGQMKSWMKSLHKEGKRIILDLIPNQTSKKHPWFVKSAKKEGKYKDYYIWAKGANAPDNKLNALGKPRWTRDNTRNEWYLHQFSETQPDLNLAHEDVVEEIKEIMKFWLNSGVSGFHIRDVQYLVDVVPGKTEENGTFVLLEKLRKVIEDFSDKPGKERLLFATLVDPTREEAMEYWGPKDSGERLQIVAPVLSNLTSSMGAEAVKSMLETWFTDDRYQWMGYVLGNQDVSRVASRMKTNEGLTIAHALQLLMPGTPFNYYGDEFGQKDVATSPYPRNGYRTPMQWNSQENAGFTTGNSTWLPIGADYKTNHVAAGSALFSEDMPLMAFKDLVKLREEESIQFGKTKLCVPQEDILVFTRKAERFPYFLTMINMGSTIKTFNLEDLDCVSSKPDGILQFHSREDTEGETFDFHENDVTLEPGDVVVVEFSAE